MPSNSIDFFTPVVDTEAMHENFKKFSDPNYKPVQKAFQEWARDFPDRDNKIVTEFQTTFNSTFWEVYLHKLFKDFGLNQTYDYAAPDYEITYKDQKILVEAVIANNAQDMNPESEAVYPDNFNVGFEYNKNAIIRYANSISSKYIKYKKSYSNLDHVKDKPFVIALGSYDQPCFFLEYDRCILPVLYGLYVDEKNEYNGETVYNYGVPVKKMMNIKKSNGSSVPLGLFTNDSMKEVSAVIFSCGATFSKLEARSKIYTKLNTHFIYVTLNEEGRIKDNTIRMRNKSETIQDSLCILHNPYATNPISQDLLSKQGVSVYNLNIEKNIFYRKINRYFIVGRMARIIIPRKS